MAARRSDGRAADVPSMLVPECRASAATATASGLPSGSGR
eukprot:CAMPEP_0115886426 /NCGR_PEP_ID=MMETSP0287-20121206/31199_1 /TAXON_ID=412157 /ORGANISM="Chrysochromulina rotalis, Strain UIO044" /LENGTH=39 /DNA_ID= /DNA_START= /DNA_END= /DNA_ORIENTATION=